nr:hypothetical protein [Fredinandcohnia onubensis]
MREKLEALVGAKISEFRRKMAEVKKTVRSIPNEVWINVRVNYKKAQQRLDNIADTIRTLQTVGGNMVLGSMLAMSPAIVPILAATVAGIAMLGPMMGVMAGSTFALATAFGFAGAAALAFGGAAIPTISKLFDENAKLTAQQKAARAEMEKVKSTWSDITKELEKPVLEAFSESMRIANKVLQMSKPLFESAAVAANNLLDSLNKSLDSAPIKAFFDYMNKSGGPMLETLGKAFGNFTQGFLSMMVAFGPLAENTAQGFLKMSQNFATWADGLKKSEKFQTFIAYVQENMPKVRAIFRDATAGLVYMFAAFGPLSADMMTGLQNMMSRFKEWARTLGENQQFQKFIGYIRENGPKVLTLIGNLTQFLVNLGIALAPMGSKILDLVNGFVSWLNTMMETHPWFGKMIGAIIILTGVFQALYPLITVAWTMFSGFGQLVIKLFPQLLTVFNIFKTNLIVGYRMMGSSIVTMGTTLLTFSKNMKLWSALMIAQVRITATRWITQIGRMIAMNTVFALRFAADIAKMVAGWALLGVKALLHAAKVAAAWFIALGPVGWVIATIVGLVALIIANWSKVKSWTLNIWKQIVSFVAQKAVEIASKVKNGLNMAVSFLTGLKSTFYNAGRGLIEQMIKGITGMVSKVTSAVSGIAQKVRNFLPFSPAKIGPLSDLNKLDFGGPIKDSIRRAYRGVQSAMTRLLAIDSPEVQFNAGVNTSRLESELQNQKYMLSEKAGSAGITQNITINSSTPLSPSEISRKQLQSSRLLALEWGV